MNIREVAAQLTASQEGLSSMSDNDKKKGAIDLL
jgi:hypothetical protein